MDTEPEILRYGQVSATRIQRYGVRDRDTFRQEFGDSWYRGWIYGKGFRRQRDRCSNTEGGI